MNNAEIKNSLEQDNTVNQKQTTSTEFEQKQQSTSFVSQFESAKPSKKEKSNTVKISAEDVHVYYGESEAIKGIDLKIYH